MVPRSIRRLGVLAAVAFAAVVGCAAPFDPAGPCTQDGRRSGAYPELEALVPTRFDGRPPDTLDSGRNCTPDGLGTLAEAGIEEVRFAGGTWQTGAQSGVTLAVFSADGLNPEQMLEFYEAGTRGSRRVERVDTAVYERNDTTLHRLDALNDASDQSILTWADGSIVRVVLVADSIGELNARADHEQRVEAALEASGAG